MKGHIDFLGIDGINLDDRVIEVCVGFNLPQCKIINIKTNGIKVKEAYQMIDKELQSIELKSNHNLDTAIVSYDSILSSYEGPNIKNVKSIIESLVRTQKPVTWRNLIEGIKDYGLEQQELRWGDYIITFQTLDNPKDFIDYLSKIKIEVI